MRLRSCSVRAGIPAGVGPAVLGERSVLNNTLKEIQKLAKGGDKDAQMAWKLLNDNRFKK